MNHRLLIPQARRCSVLWLAALACACADAEIAAGPAAATLVVQVGGGTGDAPSPFVDWSSGQVEPQIISGPAGGQFVWLALRVRGASLGKAKLRYSWTVADHGDQAERPEPKVDYGFTVDLSERERADPTWALVEPKPMFTKEPCAVAGHRAHVEVEVTDAQGHTGRAQADFRPQWTPWTPWTCVRPVGIGDPGVVFTDWLGDDAQPHLEPTADGKALLRLALRTYDLPPGPHPARLVVTSLDPLAGLPPAPLLAQDVTLTLGPDPWEPRGPWNLSQTLTLPLDAPCLLAGQPLYILVKNPDNPNGYGNITAVHPQWSGACP